VSSAGASTTTPTTATIKVLRAADAEANKLVSCTYGASVVAAERWSVACRHERHRCQWFGDC
jgi:hypothetical protein